MNIITTLAAGVLMSPANVATDIQSHDFKNPDYDWKTQKAIIQNGSEIEGPFKMVSITGTQSFVDQKLVIDDWTSWH